AGDVDFPPVRAAAFWFGATPQQNPEPHFPSCVAFNRWCRGISWHYRHLWNEVPMATERHGQIIETPTEARQAEPGPSVLALLTASTGLAILILGVIWVVFFRT